MSKEVTCIPATKTIIGTGHSQSLNVAAYCRVSSQSDEQYGSLEAQKSYYTDYTMITLIGKIKAFMLKQAQVEILKNEQNLKS